MLQTLRLEIKLGSSDNYEVDAAALAKATRQRAAWPPTAVKPYKCESDGQDAPESGLGIDRGGEKDGKVRNNAHICQ